MHEVSKVEIEKRFNGRKLTDAILHIYPSESFVSTMITNNRLTKRTQDALLTKENTLLIEPIASEFSSEREYQKHKKAYFLEKQKQITQLIIS